MIKQDIIERSFELGQRAKNIGLYVDRGNRYQSEYRLGAAIGHERILLGLGFAARDESSRILEALKIVVIELHDEHDESFGIRVMSDVDDAMYEDAYTDLIRLSLEQCVNRDVPLIATRRHVTAGQVQRALNPEQPLVEGTVPLLDASLHFGLTG